ncbi:small RNA degrading nuclease [Raphidocelis subcapitata]|uniref:Small RNA degrading nuclease n=1 Tax=Raphidocelis subcapitata TaxID=307507 RepID=A0A2V0PG81_9CHLO|nr:small RNA degrading nuclease [Raphidocelis subcapitata]|eukprot:GBF98549.1 small RNA degrading nuclease [Raphidocelis subcapitata]
MARPPPPPAASAPPPALYYSIDVECVATGRDHNTRSVAQIALVDQYERLVLNLYVRPEQPVVSYLTALTGLTQEVVEQYGRPLAEQIELLKSWLPTDATLVGQNILMDVQWLGLREGVDFAACLDLAGLFRVWNPKYNSWTMFSQDHCAKVLLGWDVDSTTHDAALDAQKSVRLYNYWQAMQADASGWAAAQAALLQAPTSESFARRNPTYEGVCMGNRKTCSCGAPFFS